MSDPSSRPPGRRARRTPARPLREQPAPAEHPVSRGGASDGKPCGAPDPYADLLAPDDLAVYLSMTADADLSSEIRLIRTLLAGLSTDLTENHAAMARVFQTLLRAIHLHAREKGDASELQVLLNAAAERVIDEADR